MFVLHNRNEVEIRGGFSLRAPHLIDLLGAGFTCWPSVKYYIISCQDWGHWPLCLWRKQFASSMRTSWPT